MCQDIIIFIRIYISIIGQWRAYGADVDMGTRGDERERPQSVLIIRSWLLHCARPGMGGGDSFIFGLVVVFNRISHTDPDAEIAG